MFVKEELAETTRNVDKDSLPITSEQLSALSQHLLDEKNAEIDELIEKNLELKQQLENVAEEIVILFLHIRNFLNFNI